MKLNVQKQDLWHDIMIQSLYRCDGVVDTQLQLHSVCHYHQCPIQVTIYPVLSVEQLLILRNNVLVLYNVLFTIQTYHPNTWLIVWTYVKLLMAVAQFVF